MLTTGKTLVLMLATATIVAGGAATLAGEEDPTWMGVFVEDVDGGIELVGIVPGGPADRAGLDRGDILVSAGDRALAGLPDLEEVLASLRPGDPIGVRLLRGGNPLEVVVRVGRRAAAARRPPAPPPAPRPPDADEVQIGWVIVDVTPDLRAHFGAPSERGVLVTGVASGRAADIAGVEVGDVVVALGNREVRDVRDAERVLRQRTRVGEDLTVSIVRSRKEQAVTLALPASARLAVADAPLKPLRAADRRERAAVERVIREEIERLERRIEELRAQLEALRD